VLNVLLGVCFVAVIVSPAVVAYRDTPKSTLEE
jgi:hypothetical protein